MKKEKTSLATEENKNPQTPSTSAKGGESLESFVYVPADLTIRVNVPTALKRYKFQPPISLTIGSPEDIGPTLNLIKEILLYAVEDATPENAKEN